VSKGDIDAPNQPKKSRDEAGSRFDTCDLMSRLWSIIDIEAAGHDHRSAATPPAFLHSHPACAAGDVLRQKAAVLRDAPRVIRIARAQKPTPFPGIARDVLAHLQLTLAKTSWRLHPQGPLFPRLMARPHDRGRREEALPCGSLKQSLFVLLISIFVVYSIVVYK
jgi:hypothetical protein